MKNLKDTQEFFNKWNQYHNLVQEMDTYKLLARALDGEIRGKVVDVGNGGVFNYNLASCEEVVAVDVALELAKSTAVPNVTYKWGDATKLPINDGLFDTCLLQLLIHRLTESNFSTTQNRTRAAILESFRVLKPGGKLVVIESCLPKIFEIGERLAYPVVSMALRCINHPMVFQWNCNTLTTFMCDAGFRDIKFSRVLLGKWVIQLGCRWPTTLTPIRVYKITALKP